MDISIFYKNFAAIMRSARARADITQTELATRAGMTRRYIQSVENEKQEATISTLFAMAEALELSPSQLISELEYAMRNGCLPDSVLKSLPPKKIGRPSNKGIIKEKFANSGSQKHK